MKCLSADTYFYFSASIYLIFFDRLCILFSIPLGSRSLSSIDDISRTTRAEGISVTFAIRAETTSEESR